MMNGMYMNDMAWWFGAHWLMMLLGAVASMFNPGTYATEPGADNAA